MGIRETIAYNKNFVTGQEIFTRKYKSTEAPMINIATVQLFDSESGELIYEAKAENVVNDIISKMAYMDYYYWRILGSVAPTTSKYSSPTQVIVLSTSTDVESSANLDTTGLIVGYADKATAYAGASTTQGTVNLAETKLDVAGNGLLHFVFDFPTNAANGTFQTIYWLSAPYPLIEFTSFAPYPSPMNPCFNKITDIFYCYSPGYYIWYKVNMLTGVYETITNTLLQSAYTSAMCFDGTNYWHLYLSTSATSTIICIQDPTSTTTIWKGVLTVPVVATYGTIYGMCYYNSKLYCITSLGYIVLFDTVTHTFNTPIAITGYTTGSVGYFRGIDYKNNSFYVSDYGGNILIIDMFFKLIGLKKLSSNVFGQLFLDNYDGAILCYGSGSTSSYKFKLNIPPGAQNLLAAPVTKSAAQTMKITYDFNIQKVL